MIVSARIQSLYELSLPSLHRISDSVRDIVGAYCAPRLYPYIGRIKTADSVAEKLESGRYDSWSELDDLFACTIIIPHLGAEKETIAYLKEQFCVTSIKGRGLSKKDPELFRFDLPRLYARLIPGDVELQSEPVFQTVFEIQIRSAYEHAWMVATHPMIYKGDQLDWNRLRLAALMKAGVEQLDMLNLSFTQAASEILGSEWPEVSLKQRVVARFRGAVDNDVIPIDVAPASWRRFADNFVTLISKRYGRDGISTQGDTVIDTVLNEITQNYAGARFLRSISLMQMIIGILCQKHVLTTSLSRYSPLISPELESFFPSVACLTGRFAL